MLLVVAVAFGVLSGSTAEGVLVVAALVLAGVAFAIQRGPAAGLESRTGATAGAGLNTILVVVIVGIVESVLLVARLLGQPV